MAIRILLFLSYFFLALSPLQLKAQEAQPVITIVYLRSGDVLTGDVMTSNDTTLVLDEWYMGSVTIRQNDIDRLEPITSNARVTLILGSHTRYSGYLLRKQENKLILRTELAGEVAISRYEIREIVLDRKKQDVLSNPNATRYFFAPSAIPIEKGKGYYQNAYLISNSVNFGISNNLTIGGGVVIPLLFYVSPKLGFKVKKNLHIGAGFIAASTFIPDATLSGGIPFGLVTYGNNETNFTIGSGYGMLWNNNGDFQHTHYPITTVNGMVRLSNRFQLVSENWIIPARYNKTEYEGNNYTEVTREVTELYMVLSSGLRIMVSQRSTVDFAPVYLYGAENAPVIPYLDFVYKF